MKAEGGQFCLCACKATIWFRFFCSCKEKRIRLSLAALRFHNDDDNIDDCMSFLHTSSVFGCCYCCLCRMANYMAKRSNSSRQKKTGVGTLALAITCAQTHTACLGKLGLISDGVVWKKRKKIEGRRSNQNDIIGDFFCQFFLFLSLFLSFIGHCQCQLTIVVPPQLRAAGAQYLCRPISEFDGFIFLLKLKLRLLPSLLLQHSLAFNGIRRDALYEKQSFCCRC